MLTGAVLALAGVAAAAMGGSKLLVLFYGARYGSYGQEFVWLMISGGVGCIASLLNCGITAARFFRLQVPIFALVVATNAFACSRLVPAWGLKGAAIAPLVAAVVHLVLAAAALVQLISGAKKIPAGSPGKPRSSR